MTPRSLDIDLMIEDPHKFREVFVAKQVGFTTSIHILYSTHAYATDGEKSKINVSSPQLVQAKEKEAFRTRLLEIAREAAEAGII